MFLTKEEAEQVLSRHYKNIERCVSNALGKFEEKFFGENYWLSSTTIANIINDSVRKELVVFAEGNSAFDIHRVGKSFFLLHENFAMRPKKVSSSLISGNIRTQRVDNMKRQECVLPGLENNTSFLTLGYTLDPITYQLSGIFLIMEEEKGVLWHSRMDKFASHEQMILNINKIEENEPKKGRVKIKTENLPSVAKDA